MHDHDEYTHSHVHTHADGEEHVHEHAHPDAAAHTHEHAHADGHTHTHAHTHDGEHAHVHTGEDGLRQTKALLKYMLEHNEHHAEELAGLLDALPAQAKKKLLLAIGTFEAANVELKAVLDSLEE
ncbi:MAG: cobalt transporter [Oscillospiraceae bacterium]|nr:cobalt transporter [Oscillospiraceae bacterium]